MVGRRRFIDNNILTTTIIIKITVMAVQCVCVFVCVCVVTLHAVWRVVQRRPDVRLFKRTVK